MALFTTHFIGCLMKFWFIKKKKTKKNKKKSDCKAVLHSFAHAYLYVHKHAK